MTPVAPGKVSSMRFVSRVRFRRLGCEITEVCEITRAACEITGGVKSQVGVNS